MIKTLLIANRGEIACRIIRSAQSLGIQTVAVYSDADRGARHVRKADHAIAIGPAAAKDSYLNFQALLEACQASGADALHPGYGFLAENADFARACAEARVRFVGPSPAAMELMGTKREALLHMAGHGIPILPGYHGRNQDDDSLIAAARDIGFPLIIKPSAGGGGKGMQVVTDEQQLSTALAGARRIAGSAFGNDTLILERYLHQPRHIEVQILADRHGHTLHLFERDCSLQRRHQKIIEEAPAPNLSTKLRERLGQCAVDVAKAVDYEGAGTVEFLYESAAETFYFMEMNTRLQVEHPVTEMVLGLDLVAEQLRIAAGESLDLDTLELKLKGHAIEVRLYAEDPRRNFLPAAGPIDWIDTPKGDHIRLDSGVSAGDRVGIDYDPMLAKLIVHGTDRASAQVLLAQALAETTIGPLITNLEFLRALTVDPNWLHGPLDTGYIDRHMDQLIVDPLPLERALGIAAVWIMASRERCGNNVWGLLRDFRLNLDTGESLRLGDGQDIHEIRISTAEDTWAVQLPSHQCRISRIRVKLQGIECRIDGEACEARLYRHAESLHILSHGQYRIIQHLPLAAPVGDEQSCAEGSLYAPMPGKIIRLQVTTGDCVTQGQELLMLEAMKMEHSLYAPTAGRVVSVHCQQGELVEEGSLLLNLQAES